LQALKKSNLSKLNTFSIPFSGLKAGKHQFDFKIEDSFFDKFDYSPIRKANVQVNIEFNKQETMFMADFLMNGEIELVCDRCGEEYYHTLHTNEKIIFKIGEESIEQTDDIVVLGRAEHEIDLTNYLYEFIVIAIPLIHIHPNNEDGTEGCNPETLAVLKKLTASETEEKTNDPDVVIDPRWEALKKLRDN
jgi:uncharacterized metal-binding protein YceD (DUF177 family)